MSEKMIEYLLYVLLGLALVIAVLIPVFSWLNRFSVYWETFVKKIKARIIQLDQCDSMIKELGWIDPARLQFQGRVNGAVRYTFRSSRNDANKTGTTSVFGAARAGSDSDGVMILFVRDEEKVLLARGEKDRVPDAWLNLVFLKSSGDGTVPEWVRQGQKFESFRTGYAVIVPLVARPGTYPSPSSYGKILQSSVVWQKVLEQLSKRNELSDFVI